MACICVASRSLASRTTPAGIAALAIDGERRVAQHRERSPCNPIDRHLERRGYQCYAVAKRLADRARALAASTSRFLGGAVESQALQQCWVACAISLTARLNASSLAFDGFDVPAILRTYCKAASCTSALRRRRLKVVQRSNVPTHPPYCARLQSNRPRSQGDSDARAPRSGAPAARNSRPPPFCSVGLTVPMPEAKSA